MTRWGSNSGYTQSSTGAFTNVFRVMGGTSPNLDNMVLNSVTTRWRVTSGNEDIRIGVYSGGAGLDDPIGATLIADLGVVNVSELSFTDKTLNASQQSIPKNTPLWIVAKTNALGSIEIQLSNVTTWAGDFQTARGRGDISGATNGTNDALAFPTTLDGTDTFSSLWYNWYLDYSIAGPTITVQPAADTVILTNETTATFSVTATGTGALLYDWELETSVGGGVYANLADGNGATWTGQAASSCTATLTAKTLSGRRVRCNVTDDNGTTTSTAVALTIYDGPTLTTFPATNGSGVSTATLTCDYVTGVGEAIEVRIPLSDGDVSVTVTTT